MRNYKSVARFRDYNEGKRFALENNCILKIDRLKDGPVFYLYKKKEKEVKV